MIIPTNWINKKNLKQKKKYTFPEIHFGWERFVPISLSSVNSLHQYEQMTKWLKSKFG